MNRASASAVKRVLRLKERADMTMRRDSACAHRMVDRMFSLAGEDAGLLAEAHRSRAHLYRAQGNYEASIRHYLEAGDLFLSVDDRLNWARTQIVHIVALGSIGLFREAETLYRQARSILIEAEQWLRVSRIDTHMGIVSSLSGDETGALHYLDEAENIARTRAPQSDEVTHHLALIQQNRSYAYLRNGKLESARMLIVEASDALRAMGLNNDAVICRQQLGLIEMLAGRYTEALLLFQEVREALADARASFAHQVAWTDLYITDCYLQMNQPQHVLDAAPAMRTEFERLSAPLQLGQLLLNISSAHNTFNHYDESARALEEARDLFDAAESVVSVAETDLRRAALALLQKDWTKALQLARRSIVVLEARGMNAFLAQAHLIAGQAALGLGDLIKARIHTEEVLSLAGQMPLMLYQVHALDGDLAAAVGDAERARSSFKQAVEMLERLRSSLVVHDRGMFLQDKDHVYSRMVALLLDEAQYREALIYTERAKSRVLVDVLAHNLDIHVPETNDPLDRMMFSQLRMARLAYDTALRQLRERDDYQSPEAAQTRAQQLQTEAVAREREMHDLWQQLSLRHADYARAHELHEVVVYPPQDELPPDTALVEYFLINDEWIAFIVTPAGIHCERGLGKHDEIAALLDSFQLNIEAVGRLRRAPIGLIKNATGLLHKLYGHLFARVEPLVSGYENLIIVPHGLLHHLPFQALHDGNGYLVERYAISLLPASSLLHFWKDIPRTNTSGRNVVLGHSDNGRLPHAVLEAQRVAELLSTTAYLDDDAQPVHVLSAHDARLVHIAAHCVFKPQNALFSAVSLADGQITTLDLLNCSLPAQLITLSACRSGRGQMQGGDELVSLSRAILYAGAESLILSLWQVEDSSTAALMSDFYQRLQSGEGKAESLRQSQLTAMQSPETTHPFFWAAFFLLGQRGPLRGA